MKTIFLLALLMPFAAPQGVLDCSDWRLPGDIIPTHYDLTVRLPDSFEDPEFSGAVNISVNCVNETDTIILHAKDLTISSNEIKVISSEGLQVKVDYVKLDAEHEKIVLRLNQSLPQGSSFILIISEFRGTVHTFTGIEGSKKYESLEVESKNSSGAKKHDVRSNTGVGLFKSTDITTNGTSQVYSSFFAPTHARKVFPCFDEPGMKATFTIRIERPGGLRSYSNTPINSTSLVPANRYLDTFDRSPPMPTYTVVILANDYAIYPNSGDDRINIVVPRDYIGEVESVYKVAKDALREMEAYTGIPYIFSKLYHVGGPPYNFNGMDHLGLNLYRRSLLLGLNSASALKKQQAFMTIIHETVHQWFGNLVTMDWWSSYWLNEAVPVYLHYFNIGEKVFTEWQPHDQFVVNEFQKSLQYDEGRKGGSVRPLTFRNSCFNKQNEYKTLYVSFFKGASILRMARGILGTEDRLKQALRIFLKNGWMKTVKPLDLFRALDQVNRQSEHSRLPHHTTFGEVLTAWTEEPGAPVVTVTRDYQSGSVSVKQERFYYNSSEKNQDTRWWIPLTWTTASSSDSTNGPQDWLYEDKTLSLNVAVEDWILFNINATGYYRVNYDEENWSLLSRALETSRHRFPVTNRAQLLDDAFALAFAGRLTFETAFNMTRFLENEDDRVVWMSASKNLKRLYTESKTRGDLDPDHRKQDLVRSLIKKAHRLVAGTGRPEDYVETHLDKALREVLTNDFGPDVKFG